MRLKTEIDFLPITPDLFTWGIIERKIPGGFRTCVEGYLCFIEPVIHNNGKSIEWKFCIESEESKGKTICHFEGYAVNASDAASKIAFWVEHVSGARAETERLLADENTDTQPEEDNT